MESKTRPSPDLDEMSLGDLYGIFWRRKWLIISGAIIGGLLAFLATYLAPKEYEAVTVLAPVSSTPGSRAMGGLSALASQFGGLASLAGISVEGDTKKAETIEVLKSQALTERFIAGNDLLPVLYSRLWNTRCKCWKTSDPSRTPTLWKANRFFTRKVRAISTDARTGLITLTVTWKDPHEAAAWANGLVKLTNDYLRQQAITTSDRDIAYLKQQAAETDMVGVKQAIYAVMENEINKAMLARGTEEYALKVLDPAQAPEAPSSPRVPLWIVAGILLGGLLSVTIGILAPERVPRKAHAAAQHAEAQVNQL